MIEFKRKSVKLTAKEQNVIYEALGYMLEDFSCMEYDDKKEEKKTERKLKVARDLITKLIHG